MAIRIVSYEGANAQYPGYRTPIRPVAYDAFVPKSAKKSSRPYWVDALDDHVRLTRGPSWTKIASSLGKTDAGVRHWRNGTRDVGMADFLLLCKQVGAEPSTILADPRDKTRQKLLFFYDEMRSQDARDQLLGAASRLYSEQRSTAQKQDRRKQKEKRLEV